MLNHPFKLDREIDLMDLSIDSDVKKKHYDNKPDQSDDSTWDWPVLRYKILAFLVILIIIGGILAAVWFIITQQENEVFGDDGDKNI